MSLDRFAKEQRRQEAVLAHRDTLQKQQVVTERDFWERVFPGVEDQLTKALQARGLTSEWTSTERGDSEWRALTLKSIGRGPILFVNAFRYYPELSSWGKWRFQFEHCPYKHSVPENRFQIGLRICVDSPLKQPSWLRPGWALVPIIGDYRFAWRTDSDTARLIERLLQILNGGQPSSDFRV